MKTFLPVRFWLASLLALWAATTPLWAATNVPPTPVILSAVQRAGTTFMDIDFRVNDPDDATVETVALGFVNGGTSFSDIVKISTLVEGTAANLGSNTPANTTLRLTWNVAADWNTNFGQVQVELLAKDSRGLLPFHWITLPASGTNPAVTINDRPIYDSDLLPIWYWLLAKSDPGLQLVNGQLLGLGGDYASNLLAEGISTTGIGRDFLWQKLNLHSLSITELTRARNGRYGFQSLDFYSVAQVFHTQDRIYGWGANDYGQANPPPNPLPLPLDVRAVAVGGWHTLVLSGNTVFGFGLNSDRQTPLALVPSNATNVTAIAASSMHSLALRADGTVVAWGLPNLIRVPSSATNLTAISAGYYHSLALRADGTIVAWGYDSYGETNVPPSATNVTAIAAGYMHSLALRADGSVVGWGYAARCVPPVSATNVIAIASGSYHNLALRADGTIVGWGQDTCGQIPIPASATNVIAIAAGAQHSLALRADGTVLAWGCNYYGQLNVPAGLSGIDLLGVGNYAEHVVVVDKRTP
jgi:hypothetical protein